jgi:VanZ family protein
MSALKRIFSWLAVFAFMGVIFYLSHQPTLPIPMRFPYQDKVFHFCTYFVLAFLWGNALRAKDRKRLALAIILTALYGISDEFHQSFVPGRDSSLAELYLGEFLYAFYPAIFRHHCASSSFFQRSH